MKERMQTQCFINDPCLARLEPQDILRFDADQRARHMAENSHEAMGEVLSRVREELAHQLNVVKTSYSECAFAELSGAARRIRKLSVQVGMPDMARVADYILDCIIQEDAVALGATVARLRRLGILALKGGVA